MHELGVSDGSICDAGRSRVTQYGAGETQYRAAEDRAP
jgi:hypothetical protein